MTLSIFYETKRHDNSENNGHLFVKYIFGQGGPQEAAVMKKNGFTLKMCLKTSVLGCLMLSVALIFLHLYFNTDTGSQKKQKTQVMWV